MYIYIYRHNHLSLSFEKMQGGLRSCSLPEAKYVVWNTSE